MNVADIKVRVRRQFGDESAAQIIDADIYRWITDAQFDIVRQNQTLLQVISASNSVVNQQDYTLPADLLVLHSIKYNNYTLKNYTLQQFQESVDGWEATVNTGTPVFYMVYASTVSLFPIPDEAIVNGIKIYYSKKPATISSDGDAISLPDNYHNAIVNYCLMQAYELDDDWAANANKGSQYQADVNDQRFSDTAKEQKYYGMTTVLDGDAGYGYGG